MSPPPPAMSHSQTWSVHCFSSRSRSLCMIGVLEWQAAGVALTSAAEGSFLEGPAQCPASERGLEKDPGAPGVGEASEHGCHNERAPGPFFHPGVCLPKGGDLDLEGPMGLLRSQAHPLGKVGSLFGWPQQDLP